MSGARPERRCNTRLTSRRKNQKWSSGIVIVVTDTSTPRIRLAMTMAMEAGRMARDAFDLGHPLVQIKADGSPVTEADRQIELYMREAVSSAFVDDGFVGEEYPDTEGDSGYRWIVDPIDGTKSFIRGVPLYANLIALLHGDEVVFGVINLPSADIIVHAERGRGCWRNGVRVEVSDRTELDGAYVMATWLEDWEPAVIADLHRNGVVLRTWGDAFGYAMVACGYADAVVDYTARQFDLAPMPVIIEEAGGRFTSLDGRRVFDAGNGIATNGRIHDSLLSSVGPAIRKREQELEYEGFHHGA
jgi:histidinol phosphatase-like enzyme (inositol monophosphatase family)